MAHRLFQPAHPQQDRAEIVLALRVARLQPHRFSIAGEGLLVLSRRVQSAAETVVGVVVTRGDFDGMPEEFLAVLPVAQLETRADKAAPDCQRGSPGQPPLLVWPRFQQPSQTPY